MVKNLTLPFSPATLISYETGTFPLSDDVCGIYLMVFAQILYDLVTLIFDLLTSAMSDEFSCMHPTQVPVFSILRLSIPELWVTQSDNITVTWNCHCACAVSRDMCIGVPKEIVFSARRKVALLPPRPDIERVSSLRVLGVILN